MGILLTCLIPCTTLETNVSLHLEVQSPNLKVSIWHLHTNLLFLNYSYREHPKVKAVCCHPRDCPQILVSLALQPVLICFSTKSLASEMNEKYFSISGKWLPAIETK